MSRRYLHAIGTFVVIAGVATFLTRASSAHDDRDDHKFPGLIHSHFDDDDFRVRQGFRIAPVHLDLRGKNRELVGLGSYLVNGVGGCNDCHTAPPYSNTPSLHVPKQVNTACYLAGGTPFGNPSGGVGLPPLTPVSRDITPWENGMPAGLTFAEFLHVIRTGEDPDNPGEVLRVMPWTVYQDMTDHDLRAIYEYLRAIPAIAPTPPGPPGPCGFPPVQ